jgi:hypothetical protein
MYLNVLIPVSFSCALFPSIKLMEMLLAISSCGRTNNLMRNAIDFSKLEQGYSERNLRLSIESRFPPTPPPPLQLLYERRKTWRQLRLKSGHIGYCSQILSPLLGRYSRLWHRVVVPARHAQ